MLPKYAPFVITSGKKLDSLISQKVMEVVEQVTTEMGADIHDELIQKLTIHSLNIDRLEQLAGHSPEINALLINMRSDFRQITDSVRKISRKLMPISVDHQSFTQSIGMLCQNMEIPGVGNVHFESTGEEQQLLPLDEVYLYRIVQELVHNAFKHSAAWHIWVRMNWEPQSLVMEVEDDGTGFSRVSDFISTLKAKHNTLRMRSQVIGAQLSYEAAEKGLLARIRYTIKN